MKNVNGADFALASVEAIGTPTLSASAVSLSQTTYDVTATGGNLATVNGTVTLGFEEGIEGVGAHDIKDLEDNALDLSTTPSPNEVTWVLDNTAPAKPTSFTATAGNTQVVLGWTAPSDTDIGKYQVRYKAGTSFTGSETGTGTGGWDDITGSDATFSGHTVTSLINGTEYVFGIRAVDTATNPGAASDDKTATPDATPTLTGTIADQVLTQGTSYTSGTAFPAATGGDGTITYAVDNLPSGITLNSDRKLTGTVTAPLAKTSLTYKATDSDTSDPDSATLTFNLSVKPQKPAGFTATAGDTEVALAWTAIAGVAKWQVQQDTGSWTDIASSGASTASHTVTGLTNGTAYSFKVRAVVGSGGTLVDGVASDAQSATPTSTLDLVPVLPEIADQLYVQGAAVAFTLPAATGGDGHPNYVYTLTPDVSSNIGLTFTASTRQLTGTPTAPRRKTLFTYTATESSDSDGTTESASMTFPIGFQPQKPANFTATAGNAQVALAWTAIAVDVDGVSGVSGWQVQQDTGSWTAISGSGATTASHTVTGLTNGTEYTFKVRAVVGSGNTLVNGVESAEKSATPSGTGPPPPGLNLTATAGNGQVTLRWNNPKGVYVNQHLLRYKKAGSSFTDGDPYDKLDISAATTSYTVTGLTNGTTYTFMLSVSISTKSAAITSSSVTATPTATPVVTPPPSTPPSTPPPPPNRAPKVRRPLPDQEVAIDSTITIGIGHRFTDADGDALTYHATSSDTTQVRVSRTGTQLTVQGVALGTAEVTVKATDPRRAAVADTFAVRVFRPNNAPVVVRPLPNQTVPIDSTITIGIGHRFTDADGDSLTYHATSSNAEAVRVSRIGTRLTMWGEAFGTAQVTMIATDPFGGAVADTFQVQVFRPQNAPMVARSLPNQTVVVDSMITVDLNGAFTDADGDTLTYQATSSDTTKARVSQTATQLTVQGVALGTAEVMVKATDPFGAAVADTFQVQVFRPNNAPVVARSLPNQTVVVDSMLIVDLNGVFTDADGDALALTATSSDPAVATAAVLFKLILSPNAQAVVGFSPILLVKGTQVGVVAIEVVARDPKNATVSTTFTATVAADEPSQTNPAIQRPPPPTTSP